MKGILKVIVLAVIMFAASPVFAGGWIYYTDGPFKGKVIDLETGAPIEGAVVAGVWYVDQYGGAGGVLAAFCDAKETLTDKNGDFEVPRASCWHWWPFSNLGSPSFTVFKPGYLGYPPLGFNLEEKRTRMPDFKGGEFLKEKGIVIRLGRPKTREEREFTHGDAGSPFTNDEAFKMLPNLLKLINEDRKALGLTGNVGPVEKGGGK